MKFDESGKAVQIVEKPKDWISDFAIPGLYVFDNRVISAAKESRPSDRGEIEITDLMNFYLEKGELQVSQVKGDWLDAGTFDTLLEASQIVKEKNISKNFDPQVQEAILEFNEEQKALAKKQLQ